MNWVNLAILSAAIMGAVNIIDSHLLSKRMPGLRAFLLPVGIIYLAFASLVYALFPFPAAASVLPVLVTVVSGVLRTIAVLIMLNSLKRQEVAQVIPVVHTYPIFVALMAVPLLGESLDWLKWLAIAMVVLGAVMVSARLDPSGSATWKAKPMLLLFGSSLLFAASDVTGKYALSYISFWNVFAVSTFCMSSIFLLMSIRPWVASQLLAMPERGLTMGLLGFNEALALGGAMLSFWALNLGPVSLVSTIISSRPLFVVIFAFALSRIAPSFLEWDSSKGMLALRFIAVFLIVGGITIIHIV